MFKSLSCVKWRINVNALYFSGIFRFQCLEGEQIIPMNEHVFCMRVSGRIGKRRVFDKQARFYPDGRILSIPRQFQFIRHDVFSFLRRLRGVLFILKRLYHSGKIFFVKRKCFTARR